MIWSIQIYVKSRLLNKDKIKMLRTKYNVGGRFYKKMKEFEYLMVRLKENKKCGH